MSWIPYALLAAVCAALVAIFGKIGLAKVDPTLATTLRGLIMAGFLVGAATLLGKWQGLRGVDGRAWKWIALSGVAGALSWLFYFVALKQGPAAGVAALDRLSVVFVVLAAALFLGEAFTWRTGLGAVLIVIGALLVAWRK